MFECFCYRLFRTFRSEIYVQELPKITVYQTQTPSYYRKSLGRLEVKYLTADEAAVGHGWTPAVKRLVDASFSFLRSSGVTATCPRVSTIPVYGCEKAKRADVLKYAYARVYTY